MSKAIRFKAEPCRELVFGSISGTYTAFGDPMANAIRVLIIQNTTDTGLMISLNGVDDHIPIVTNGYLAIDIAGNKTLPQGFFLAEGEQLYIKQLGGAATSGSIYLSAFYGAEV